MTNSIANNTLAWVLTYSIHSTLLIGLAWLVTRRNLTPNSRDFIWKTAMIGGLITSFAQSQLNLPPASSFALNNSPTAFADNAPSRIDNAREHAVIDKEPAATNAIEAKNAHQNSASKSDVSSNSTPTSGTIMPQLP